jgi:hypothetical protein
MSRLFVDGLKDRWAFLSLAFFVIGGIIITWSALFPKSANGGVVYDFATQGCCGTSVYDLATQGCCGGNVYSTASEGCCNGVSVYNLENDCCCTTCDDSGTEKVSPCEQNVE